MTHCIFLKQSFITFIHKVSRLARGLFVRFSHVTHSNAVVIPIIVVAIIATRAADNTVGVS
jgi:hypothetical protein